jgi:hypothetical protein
MEFYQGKCLFNVMDGNQKWTSPTRTITSLGGALWANNFHVWTWEWDSTKIDLSLDGTLINHYLLTNADGTGPGGTNPFKQPGYVLVNQAIGGANGGDPSSTVFPVEYRIDWLRVHTWTQSAAYALTVNNGVGSGPYVAGTAVSITSKMPATGQVFDKWVIVSGSPVIDTITNASAMLTMPVSDATITATYRQGTSVVYSSRSPHADIRSAFNKEPLIVYDVFGRRLVRAVMEPAQPLPAGVYILVRQGHPVKVPVASLLCLSRRCFVPE